MTKQINENPLIVMKVSVIDTFRNIKVGQTIPFDCRDFAPFGSAKTAVSRLNDAAGCEAYKIVSDDNGATYTVSRFA